VTQPAAPVTAYLLEGIILRFFPGGHVITEQRIGGTVVKLDVWKYHLEISLTTDKIKLVDVPGEMTVRFVLRPDKGSPTLILTKTTTDLSQVKEIINAVQEYLSGIAAAIMMALEEPAEKPPANIFI
jgi:hypothetical protein